MAKRMAQRLDAVARRIAGAEAALRAIVERLEADKRWDDVELDDEPSDNDHDERDLIDVTRIAHDGVESDGVERYCVEGRRRSDGALVVIWSAIPHAVLAASLAETASVLDPPTRRPPRPPQGH